jgi:hypothetical protein
MQILQNEELPEEFQHPEHDTEANFKERVDRFKQWCIDNKVFHYARPKDKFVRSEAFQLAEKAGCNKIILEELPAFSALVGLMQTFVAKA